jgi:uncharacterized membrane protein (DUF485 family)
MDKPSQPPADEHPELTYRNARHGLMLFAIYLAVYAVFVWLAAFAPDIMGHPTQFGPNVAIVYGFGLIVGAFVLALIYMFLCQLNAWRVAREERK